MYAFRSALSRLALLALVLSSLAARDSGTSTEGLDLDRLFVPSAAVAPAL